MSYFTIYKSEDTGNQNYRWNLKDDNHKIIAHSEEAFHKENALKSVEKMQCHINQETEICLKPESTDTSKYRFEYHQSEEDGQWYWTLKAGGNHEPMAIGEGYGSKSNVMKGLENIRLEMPRAEIKFQSPEDQKWYKALLIRREDTTETKGIPGSSKSSLHMEQLVNILIERGIKHSIPDTADIPNIPDTVIIIQNYKPLNIEDHHPFTSIALAVNFDGTFSPKTWLNYTSDKIQKIDGTAPQPHDDYSKFIFNGLKYHPYSINVEGFSFVNIVKLLDSLYLHINFDS